MAFAVFSAAHFSMSDTKRGFCGINVLHVGRKNVKKTMKHDFLRIKTNACKRWIETRPSFYLTYQCLVHRLAMDKTRWTHIVNYVMDTNGH